MARAAHNAYREEQRAIGFEFDSVKDKHKKTNPLLIDYRDLPEKIKEQNRDQVCDIPNKLAYAGCYLVPALETESPFFFEDKIVEELASHEHTRWMRMKAHTGWRWDSPRDNNRKLSPLLPWAKGDLSSYRGFEQALGREGLQEDVKQKDRDAVIKIPRIVALAKAGVPLEGSRDRGSSPLGSAFGRSALDQGNPAAKGCRPCIGPQSRQPAIPEEFGDKFHSCHDKQPPLLITLT